MKYLIKVSLCLSVICASFYTLQAQEVNYSPKGNVKIFGESNRITVSASGVALQTSGASVASFAAFVPLVTGAIDFAFKLTTHLIEKNAKKFIGEYSARNINKEKKVLPKFTFERKIQVIGESGMETAAKLSFEPEGNGSDLFAFKLTDVVLNYSKAKTTGKYQYIDLTVEVGVVYNDGVEKKTENSTAIVIPLVRVGDAYTLATDSPIYSDNFANKSISEIFIKVVECNPYKIKAEKIKELSDKFSDDAKGLAKEAINIFIDNEK